MPPKRQHSRSTKQVSTAKKRKLEKKSAPKRKRSRSRRTKQASEPRPKKPRVERKRRWKTLEHKGPLFAPDYQRLPSSVQLKYQGKPVKLSEEAEEVAGFYAMLIDHDYTKKDKFNENFFHDWRETMTSREKKFITDLSKCDFREINQYYKKKAEERKEMSKEEKLRIKKENERLTEEYGVAIMNGKEEKVGNFRIEPPGLFRGRGNHPKMGMLKERIQPEDVTINCSAGKEPRPPKKHHWKSVIHDNTLTWLACWNDSIQNRVKYVFLDPTSSLRGEKDEAKYEKARKLAKSIGKIRQTYERDWGSKDMRTKQLGVAIYFIDKLALRAGNEKGADQADTVGCCSLRYEHIKLEDRKDGKTNVVIFDFLGKDSIPYKNEVSVDPRAYKNLKLFMKGKKRGDDLFDHLNPVILNNHLSEHMEGLTAKVFRTYNASHTLEQQLRLLTPAKGSEAEKVLAYKRANREVAILCNHQRAVPKTFEKSMKKLRDKIKDTEKEIKLTEKDLKKLKKGSKDFEKMEKKLNRLKERLEKLKIDQTDKEENATLALGTSKLNYMDPRITVAWCDKYSVPIGKIFNKAMIAKFKWAIDSAKKSFRFG